MWHKSYPAGSPLQSPTNLAWIASTKSTLSYGFDLYKYWTYNNCCVLWHRFDQSVKSISVILWSSFLVDYNLQCSLYHMNNVFQKKEHYLFRAKLVISTALLIWLSRLLGNISSNPSFLVSNLTKWLHYKNKLSCTSTVAMTTLIMEYFLFPFIYSTPSYGLYPESLLFGPSRWWVGVVEAFLHSKV